MLDTTPLSSIYYTSGSTATITINYTSSITDPSGVVVENNTDYLPHLWFLPAAVAMSPDAERGRL
jgi:hypothetical protein